MLPAYCLLLLLLPGSASACGGGEIAAPLKQTVESGADTSISSGSHFLEFHLPTSGISMAAMAGSLLLFGGAYLVYSWARDKRRAREARERAEIAAQDEAGFHPRREGRGRGRARRREYEGQLDDATEMTPVVRDPSSTAAAAAATAAAAVAEQTRQLSLTTAANLMYGLRIGPGSRRIPLAEMPPYTGVIRHPDGRWIQDPITDWVPEPPLYNATAVGPGFMPLRTGDYDQGNNEEHHALVTVGPHLLQPLHHRRAPRSEPGEQEQRRMMTTRHYTEEEDEWFLTLRERNRLEKIRRKREVAKQWGLGVSDIDHQERHLMKALRSAADDAVRAAIKKQEAENQANEEEREAAEHAAATRIREEARVARHSVNATAASRYAADRQACSRGDDQEPEEEDPNESVDTLNAYTDASRTKEDALRTQDELWGRRGTGHVYKNSKPRPL